MLKVICDFCGEEITTKQNKGGEVKDFRLEENICGACKKADLGEAWETHQTDRDKDWGVIIYERRKFFEALLKHQKKEWIIQKKKEHFGSFFDKNKIGGN